MLGNFDAGSYLYRVGTWQTFFGPVWADFGYFGLFFVGLIGAATERMASAVRRGYFPIVPLYIYMIVVIFFMPVVNLLISGFGLFTVVSFAVFAVFTSGKAPEITNSQRFTRTEPRQGAADA